MCRLVWRVLWVRPGPCGDSVMAEVRLLAALWGGAQTPVLVFRRMELCLSTPLPAARWRLLWGLNLPHEPGNTIVFPRVRAFHRRAAWEQAAEVAPGVGTVAAGRQLWSA